MRGDKIQQLERIADIYRITPACAGIRICRDGNPHVAKDHPRMRGDKIGRGIPTPSCIGSPPHARG